MTTVHTENHHYATDEQQIAVITVATFSSTLSLFGSLSIIIIIARNNKWRKGLFYRLLLGITVGDIIASIGFIVGPYSQPPDPHLVAAFGNTATCSFNGVLVYTLFLTVYYNCALSLFYYFTIVQGMKEKVLSMKYEKWMHSVSIAVTLLVHIISLSLEAYNPTEVGRNCGVSHYPTGCEHDADEECTRGLYTYELGYAWLALLAVPTGMGVALTVWVYVHVRKILKANQRHSFDVSVTRNRENQRRREVAQQAVLYCIALINTLAWAVATVIYDWASKGNTRSTLGKPEIFAFNLLNSFFVPLQGILNFIVYARPRYLELRKMSPDEGRFYAFRELYSTKPLPNASARNRVASRNHNVNENFQVMDSLAGAQKESAPPRRNSPVVMSSNTTNHVGEATFIEEGNESGD